MYSCRNPLKWPLRENSGLCLDFSNPFTPMLSACLRFQEGSGAPVELFTRTSVTLGGTTTWGVSGWPNQGPCWIGNGTTGFGNIQLPRMNSWAKFTLSILWTCPAAGSSTTCRVLERGGEIALIEDPGNGHVMRLDIGASAGPNSSIVIYDNKWHVITATYDGANARLYHDGIPSNQNPTGVGTKTGGTGDLYFFRTNSGNSFFSASQLGGFWFWKNRVFNDKEVYDFSLSPWQIFAPIESYWLPQGAVATGNPAALLPAM